MVHEVGASRLRFVLALLLILCVPALSAGAQVPREYALVLNNAGVRAVDHKEWTVAIEKLTQAVAVNSGYKLAAANLSAAYNGYALSLEKSDEKKAFQQFHWAAYFQANHSVTENLGNMMKRLGKNQNSYLDHLHLGDSFKKDGDLISCLIEYKAALRVKNDHHLRIELNDVENLLKKQTATQAKQIVENLAAQIALHSFDDNQDEIDLADIYVRRAQWKEAIKVLLHITEVRPEETETWFLLASCYRNSGDQTSACNTLKSILGRATVGSNDEKSALRELIECNERRGELEELLASWRKYVDDFPTAADAKTIAEEIRFLNRTLRKPGRTKAGQIHKFLRDLLFHR